MRILVIGTGYVGLVTGACFAEMGHHVTCLDIDKVKIERLTQGIIPIYEPGLEEIVKRNLKDGRLYFTTDYKKAIKENLILFIAVGTPSYADGTPNLSYVHAAALEIAHHIDEYKVIVNKSTVPVGTAERIRNWIQLELDAHKKTVEFDLVSNPEFLKEGDAIHDFMKPDRIIIGVESPRAKTLMTKVYSFFNFNHERIIIMDIASAEMSKLAANAMLSLRISFMNELSHICEKTGADITSVRQGIGSDLRIGFHFLYAGVGYGGSCFPKDIRALNHLAEKVGEKSLILEAVDKVNETQKTVLSKKIISFFKERGEVCGKTIAIWGLSFKPNTDDMREAPSLSIIEDLLNHNMHVRLFDPVAMPNAKALLKQDARITWCQTELEACEGADAIALITEWKQFRSVSFESLLKVMHQAVLFDGRNQYNPQEMKEKGFEYISIGRKALVLPIQMKGNEITSLKPSYSS